MANCPYLCGLFHKILGHRLKCALKSKANNVIDTVRFCNWPASVHEHVYSLSAIMQNALASKALMMTFLDLKKILWPSISSVDLKAVKVSLALLHYIQSFYSQLSVSIILGNLPNSILM